MTDDPSASGGGAELTRVVVNGVELATFDTGGDGPLALCLHGFPDSAHSWRHLLPRLADAGFRAVAPFQRGYAPSAVPVDGRYQTGALSLDANALHDVLGGDGEAVIIGHDFGAPAAYGAAVSAPDRWRVAVAMAVPPGGTLGAALLGDLGQLKRSWYMFLFQHGLAEMVVSANDLAFIDMMWSDWSPGHDAVDDLTHAKDSLREPAHLAAALGYYRAALGDGFVDPDLSDLQAATQQVPSQPTLYLHGADDGCIGVEVAETARPLVGPNVTIEIVPHAGHFLHLERPDIVNDRIVEFVS